MLCRGFPAEFRSYFEHVRSLRFDDRPDYDYVKRLFRELFFRKGFSYDNIFDWEELSMAQKREGASGPNTFPEEDGGVAPANRAETRTPGASYDETPSGTPGHGYQTRGAKKG